MHHVVPWRALLATIAGLLAPGPAASPAAPERIPRLVFSTECMGVDKAGACVWKGRVEGAVMGEVILALRQVEDPAESAKPVWHVRARWSIAATPPRRSFAADLEGMVDWKSGTSQLSGVITAGWMKGAWIRQEGRFVRGDVTGTLEITPSLASR